MNRAQAIEKAHRLAHALLRQEAAVLRTERVRLERSPHTEGNDLIADELERMAGAFEQTPKG